MLLMFRKYIPYFYRPKLDLQLYFYIGCLVKNYSFLIGNVVLFTGQGRLDGAFCDYTLEDKLSFLNKVHKAGVRNIEMESVCFAAMCKRAGIPAAVLCVTLLDRLKNDQVDMTAEQHEDFQSRPQKIVAAYFKHVLEENAHKPNYYQRHGNKRAKAM